MQSVPRGWFSRSRSLADFDARFGSGAIVQAIEERRSGGGETRVLEIGCGEGRVLMELRKRFPTVALHGINRNPWPAMQGSQSLPDTAAHYGIFEPGQLAGVVLPGIHFYDAAALAFPSAYFDIAISQVSIPYVARKDRLIEEVWRTLKPGGTAFLHVDSSRGEEGELLAGDTPCFVLHRGAERIPASELFARLRAEGYDLRYEAQRFSDGGRQLLRFLLVMRKTVDKPLLLGLAFDERNSFDLTSLHRAPQDWKTLWGYRSVYRLDR